MCNSLQVAESAHRNRYRRSLRLGRRGFVGLMVVIPKLAEGTKTKRKDTQLHAKSGEKL